MAPGDSEGIPRDDSSYVEELCSDINDSLHTEIIFRLTYLLTAGTEICIAPDPICLL